MVDTPYSEIRDGKEYPVLKNGTYLKLGPGESGQVDCLTQFRYNYGGGVRGIRDAVLASYMVFNVSDDKPKVVIRRMSVIQRDSLLNNQEGNTMYVDISDVEIDSNLVAGGNMDAPATVFVNTPKTVKTPYRIGIFYPEDMLSCSGTRSTYQYEMDARTPGYVQLEINVGNDFQVDIPFRAIDGIDLGNRTSRYISFSENVVYGHDGVKMDVVYGNGRVMVTNPAYKVLVSNTSSDVDVVSAYVSICENSDDLGGKRGYFLDPTR